MDDKSRLITLLKERSVRTGHIVLASGKTSDFYVDARQTTLSSEGANLVARMILTRLHSDVIGVGGPVTGADPIAGAVAALSWQRGQPIHGFMVRKEPKGHGTGHCVEGRFSLPNGSKVCVVEDTVTTGGSLLKAIQHAENEGLEVIQCITIVDRLEGAEELLKAAGHQLESLVTRQDLL